MSRSAMASDRTGLPVATAGSRTYLIPVFAVAFATLLLVPPLLSMEFGPYPYIKIEEVFGLLAPLVLIPLYWLLLREARAEPVGLAATVAFLLCAVLWVDGHGIHLAANSISRLLADTRGGAADSLAYFYDEVLGHYLWHVGVVGLSVLLVARERSTGAGAAKGTARGALLASGVAYGFAFFLIAVEGQTTPLGVPTAVLFTLYGLSQGRNLARRPLLSFFLAGYLVAALLFAGWWAYWGGLPELSEVGLL